MRFYPSGGARVPPVHGQERTKTWFAIWPVTIGFETRLWEKVTVKQRYFDYLDCPDAEWRARGRPLHRDWENIEFIGT